MPVGKKGTPSAKSPTEKQMRDNARAHVSIREEAFLKNGNVPDIVVSPTGPNYISQTEADRKKERLILAEEFEKFFAKYPQTLFVHSAGNKGCRLEESPHYAWSDIDLENLVVVGSCDFTGKRSKFSNYGPDVDIYGHGEDIVIDEQELYRFPIFRKSKKHVITGTSFSAPRIANSVAKILTDQRKENPHFSAIEAFKVLRSTSQKLRTQSIDHKKN